jgi:AraC-like DNA-binding protein
MIAESFLQLVGNHFREQHLPLFYAARLHITKSYLRKCCQKAIGISPMGCIQVRLMLEACALLARPGLSIQEVAWMLGFDDPVYFARFFKRQGGLPPGAYRKIVCKMA